MTSMRRYSGLIIASSTRSASTSAATSPAREQSRVLMAEAAEGQQRVVDAARELAATAPGDAADAAETNHLFWADAATWSAQVAAGEANPLESPWDERWMGTVEDALGELDRTVMAEC